MINGKKVAAICLAAGESQRMGRDKMFIEINGESVLHKSLWALNNNGYIDEIIIAAGKNIQKVKMLGENFKKVKKTVPGGATRALSVANAISRIESADILAIHDAARPFVSDSLINRVIEAGEKYGARIPAVPLKDTVKVVKNSIVISTPDRETLRAVQTPQVFSCGEYKEILKTANLNNITDDSSIFERNGKKVIIVDGEYTNYKITTEEDLKGGKKMRVGHGYDVHRLVEGRKLIICGVDIPFEKGLLGHSDADVATHAVIDAILGRAAMGDIGAIFPDNDEKYKNADSIKLLSTVTDKAKENGYTVLNIDVSIICQKPKLAKYIPQMRKSLADAMGIDIDSVSVKATTEENLGFTGSGEGISCHAVTLLERVYNAF